MEATDISLFQRTTEKFEKGGFEEWSFFINNNEYTLFCDIRIPGLISTFYEDIPTNRNKVCMSDIMFITKDNIPVIYNPSQSNEEVKKAVQSAVIKILLEKIKPVRNFNYVNFVFSKNNKIFFQEIFNQICTEGDSEFKQKILRLIKPEVQSLIDADQLEFLTGPLK